MRDDVLNERMMWEVASGGLRGGGRRWRGREGKGGNLKLGLFRGREVFVLVWYYCKTWSAAEPHRGGRQGNGMFSAIEPELY